MIHNAVQEQQRNRVRWTIFQSQTLSIQTSTKAGKHSTLSNDCVIITAADVVYTVNKYFFMTHHIGAAYIIVVYGLFQCLCRRGAKCCCFHFFFCSWNKTTAVVDRPGNFNAFQDIRFYRFGYAISVCFPLLNMTIEGSNLFSLLLANQATALYCVLSLHLVSLAFTNLNSTHINLILLSMLVPFWLLFAFNCTFDVFRKSNSYDYCILKSPCSYDFPFLYFHVVAVVHVLKHSTRMNVSINYALVCNINVQLNISRSDFLIVRGEAKRFQWMKNFTLACDDFVLDSWKLLS